MAVINKLQRAYLAGLIDGEGYIGILKVKKGNKKVWGFKRDYTYYPVFKICMTDYELIKWLHNSFGGNFETRPRHKMKSNWKDAYTWTVKKVGCIDILKLVYPYLKSKKKEVEILIKFSKLNNGAGYPVSDENWKQRDELYQQIRDLHYRGQAAEETK